MVTIDEVSCCVDVMPLLCHCVEFEAAETTERTVLLSFSISLSNADCCTQW